MKKPSKKANHALHNHPNYETNKIQIDKIKAKNIFQICI